MLFLLKASRWTKQKSSRFSFGHLQETSKLFNLSLALPTYTTDSLRIVQRRSVHSAVSSRKIPVSPSMRKLSVSFTNARRLSPLLQSYPTSILLYQPFRKPIPTELKYEINDKELLGIVWALKHWRAFRLSLSSPVEVLTDPSSLQYFMSTKVLPSRQSHRVGVPNDPTIQLRIIQKHQDSPLAGHPCQEKTIRLGKRDFHWSGMTQFIKDYVSCCKQCSRSKNIHHKKFGLLKPLPIPNGPWICLSMDFITQLPLSNSFDSILVIVDRFSKMAVFIPTMSSITSLDLAHLFIKNIFSKHGLPSSIVSDRGPLFVSSFWTNLCQQLKISRDLSTAYHPETDGQTERVNQILEQYLRMYVSYHQDDWNTWLPLAEFAYNNSDHSSTKQSPFFTVYGRDPQF
ncbi:hypothetical protein O181_113360, partial [Austropuccinia psidii MF-1]|nr:hypothetical protein [Austropuccinia psidii MF-1]